MKILAFDRNSWYHEKNDHTRLAESGTLFVAYAQNKENCEVAALPIKHLLPDRD